MTNRPSRSRTGPPLRSHRPAWVADPIRSGRAAPTVPGRGRRRYGGTWLAVTDELVSEVAYDTEHFTSRSVVVSEERPGPDDLPAPIGLSPPMTSAALPRPGRGMLLPAFGPGRPPPSSPTPGRCAANARGDRGPGGFDAATNTPGTSGSGSSSVPGVPRTTPTSFRQFIRLVLEEVDMAAEDEERQAMFGELDAYMDAEIDDDIARPTTTSPRSSSTRRSAAPS